MRPTFTSGGLRSPRSQGRSVKETIPRWCEDKRTVAWDVLELAPDTTLGHMLDETSFDESPPQVLSWLEDRDPACASETQWGGAIAAADYRAANPTDFRHLALLLAAPSWQTVTLNPVHPGKGIFAWATRLSSLRFRETQHVPDANKMSRRKMGGLANR
eukprot:CAMPEP_0198225826 /NCGR_PEP_ID=MMETSP1445-20131203/102728_1 /TAXON_ID=36898 /ORGANISM="Pyramimonas sp., Strain CCMP2087" /LENGTH=158 /DNA_ID=CAMNT_0043905471 /DNA_START=1321 /DNA_END=1798 /DNA_ORIENTATION=+